MTKENVKETKVEETANRGNVGTVTVEKPKVSTTVKLGDVRDSFWYRKHEGELADVTNEISNPKLGIEKIGVFPPSEAQANNGVLASVQIETAIGTIRSIQVKESQNVSGAIYLQTGSRNIAKEGQPAKWFNEVTLKRAVSAQVLSYIDTLLVPVQEGK